MVFSLFLVAGCGSVRPAAGRELARDEDVRALDRVLDRWAGVKTSTLLVSGNRVSERNVLVFVPSLSCHPFVFGVGYSTS